MIDFINAIETERFFTIAAVFLACFLLVGVVSCTVVVDLNDPDEIRADAVLKEAEAKVVEASQQGDLAKIQVVKELITNGTSPIAARCGIYGADNKESIILCDRHNK